MTAQIVNPLDAYARSVVSGQVPAGKYHRLACERHLRDRTREGTPGFPYRFDQAKADRLVRFAEKLKHYKGEWAGTRIHLEPWEQFVLGSVVGWLHVKTGLRRFRTAFNQIPRKNGKACAVDTLVATPKGWARHGDLHRGDYVFGADGYPKMVEWVSEHYEGPCFEVLFSGGQSIIAHARHEWATERTWYTKRKKGPPKGLPLPLVETREIAATLTGGTRRDFVHRVRVSAALELPDVSLPIPPYTFGAWLGDGSSGSGTITFADDEIAARIRSEGVPCRARSKKGRATLYGLTTGDRSQRARNASVENSLRCLGVLHNKHIPMLYKRASLRQRLELLRGIVDTDGHCGSHPRASTCGCYEIVSVHAQLANDIIELLHTLGLKATMNVDRARLRGEDMGPRYRILFYRHDDQVAHLSRKQSADSPTIWKRRSRARTIVGCSPCGSTMVNCLQVEGGTYLVGEHMIPTHNSLLAAIVLLYLAFFDDEPGAEGYAIATKRDQAKIVFGDAKRLVQSSGLKDRIVPRVSALLRDATASKVEPLGADYDSTDGLNPNVVIVDEMHAMKDRGLLDVMETATGARRQPLMFEITTFGNDPVSPWGDQHDYACKILEGVLDDESFFTFSTHADPDDDWASLETARKANPNYGVSVKPDDLAAKLRKAKGIPAAAASYKQKHLNLLVNADAPWLSLDGWRKGQSVWSPDDLAGQSCYVGVDLASKIDLCALVFVFPPMPGRAKWMGLPYIWTPAETVPERAHRDRAPYPTWIEQGYLLTTPGTTIDHGVIRDVLKAERERFDLEFIGFDPWHAHATITALKAEDGFTDEQVLEVRQGPLSLSAATVELGAQIADGNMDAGGSPLMAWCASNVVVEYDRNQNPMLSKKRSRNRIDPFSAIVNAMSLALRMDKPEASVYLTRGIRTLGT